MNRSWMFIFIGAMLEVIWVTGFKHADDPLFWAATIAALLISFYLVIAAATKLPVGTMDRDRNGRRSAHGDVIFR